MISMKVILELQLIPHLFPQLSDCDSQFVTLIFFFSITHNWPYKIVVKMGVKLIVVL